MHHPPVLFVCTRNVFRSRFAEALFNWTASKTNLSVRAISRGLAPQLALEDSLSPYVEGALRSNGISLSHTSPTKSHLRENDLRQSLRVIVLNDREHRAPLSEQYPDLVASFEFWNVEELSRWEPERMIGHIEEEVRALVMGLREQSMPSNVLP